MLSEADVLTNALAQIDITLLDTVPCTRIDLSKLSKGNETSKGEKDGKCN